MPKPENIKGKGFKDRPENINKKGRPKLPDLSELMAEILGEEKDGITAAAAILRKLRQQAAAGNIKAAEVLLDRGYGRAKQQTDVTISDERRPIVFEYLPDNELEINPDI